MFKVYVAIITSMFQIMFLKIDNLKVRQPVILGGLFE